MLNVKVDAVRQVRDSIHPAEDALDRSLGQIGKLIHTTCEARIAAKLPAHITHDALLKLASATALLGQAREQVISAHASFAKDRAEILPTFAWGDFGCPTQAVEATPAKGSDEIEGPLRLVG